MDSDNECFYDCDEDLTCSSDPLPSDDGKSVMSSKNDISFLSSADNSTLSETFENRAVSDQSEQINKLDAEDENSRGDNCVGYGDTKDHATDEEQEETLKDWLTNSENEELKKDSIKLKETGNRKFKLQNFAEAEFMYSEGLRLCPSSYAKERSILYSNRAACRQHLDRKGEAIEDCTEAICLEPRYLKALLRRARLHEESEKLEEALSDYKSVVEIDPTISVARTACQRLPDQINARNEKLKEEMLGTLKDLGNKVLGKFGLSTDNFQLQQNKDTGAYNIQFSQNPGNS